MALGEGLWVSVPETMGSLWGLQRAQADAENKGGGSFGSIHNKPEGSRKTPVAQMGDGGCLPRAVTDVLGDNMHEGVWEICVQNSVALSSHQFGTE